MRRWAAAGLTAAGGTVAVLGVAAAVAARRWDEETARAVARLHAGAATAAGGESHAASTSDSSPCDSGTFDPACLAAVPAPVRRYLAFALVPGQPLVRRARVEHAGEFASQPGRWAPFTSVQHFTAGPPGFVWDARLPMLPLAGVRVRDAYVDGEGSMRAAVAALVPVGGQRGTPEIAASALWRHLAESVWLPTALLPSPWLRWTAVDDSTARATLTDRGTTATAEFQFGPTGAIERVTGLRYRAVGDGQVLTPTDGRHGDYRRVGGMMIPTTGEVGWLLPEGPHAYWRGRLVRASFEYEPRRARVAEARR